MKKSAHAADYYRRILSRQAHSLTQLDAFAKIVLCNRGQKIPRSVSSAGQWYCVIAGAVRRCALRADGRRQILDLMLPRDFFFVRGDGDEVAIEAIVDETALASYPGEGIEQLAERDPKFARELRDVAFRALGRSQAQLMIVGGVTALEKVGSFLLSLDRRSSDEDGQVVLPVSRYDIADYLAVSVETVCRSFTNLQQRGAIRLAGKRTVKILNRAALEDHIGEPGSRGLTLSLKPVERRSDFSKEGLARARACQAGPSYAR
ncbi:helix-turn-helix domain-containing protein [Bradyrhizobium australafricanum]|uniref:helix-turn-helix domain-containing protein n=1 Tax=Bradyrhizobium australafricanum TaxID=2821406 RepID=UPI001CE2FF3B|nr:helix-turn-helix domain-containing protein [Bradyrhizobium australafricanum]MCA6100649.1 helix-turn-helix domain-containing protein [Bradyrhizobium australafricanum]